MKKVRELASWKAKELYTKVQLGQIRLDADYQREIIWNKEKQSRLIDSILNDIDIPKLYFARVNREEEVLECIDGKQRINSLVKFYTNELKTPKGKTYAELSTAEQKRIDSYEFTISIFINPDEEYIRELFDRLNFGVPLNSGEKLNAKIGDMRNFIFNIVGKHGPFIGGVGASEKRYSKQFALAQIVINSIPFRGVKGEFRRARFEDLSLFFDMHKRLSKEDLERINKIKDILKRMSITFGKDAKQLTSRAAIVSAYLFFEEMLHYKQDEKIQKFVEFYLELLTKIEEQNELLNDLEPVKNKVILEKFQKYLQQASVEPYSIYHRHDFLTDAFEYYLKTGKIIGSKK